jgi:protoporphyrinogen IX oxidase
MIVRLSRQESALAKTMPPMYNAPLNEYKKDAIMLWIKAFHLISMVAWFSGLFYLPRLYVYHALATDSISLARFKIMEKKLYYFISTPAAFLTVFFGLWLISFNVQGYMQMQWFHMKLGLVLLLLIYHAYLGVALHRFAHDNNKHGHVFYRIMNEIPALFLIAIIILAVVKPFGIITH